MLNKYIFIVVRMYTTHSSEFYAFINNLENNVYVMAKPHKFFAVAGDLNISILEPNKPQVQHSLNIHRSINVFYTNALPTRIG